MLLTLIGGEQDGLLSTCLCTHGLRDKQIACSNIRFLFGAVILLLLRWKPLGIGVLRGCEVRI